MNTFIERISVWQNQAVLILLFVILSIATWRLSRQKPSRKFLEDGTSKIYKEIERLENFDWRNVDFVKLRNFKPTYNLTMGLQTATMSDLVLMDKTYESKIMLRRGVIDGNEADVVGFNPIARDAVFELYHYLFETYLPRRFPSMFIIEESTKDGTFIQRHARNLVKEELIPLLPAPSDPRECLGIMGRHIDGEFALLLPECNPNAKPFRATPTAEPTNVYHLHAYILAFPSGFNTPQKLGLPLAAIHGPVPGYEAKLERSMDRYFATMPFGKLIWRANWSISVDGEYFKLVGNHTDIRHDANTTRPNSKEIRVEMAPPTYEATLEELNEWKEASKKVDPEKCFLRMERQTLHRLEKTGALVFGFKTIMEPLPELKKEGSGPKLAAALEGLRAGNVPAMDMYKNGVIWREPAVKYLSS